MKQERISELLRGTPYEGVYLSDDLTPWVCETNARINAAIDRVNADATINAARVQLLAKVLYWVEAWLVEEADTTQGISRKDAAQRVRAALKESGLDG